MKAIILAAGMGRRLAEMGWDRPKCLLPIAGTTLLGNILDSLRHYGVTEAAIVVGYRREMVEVEANRHAFACHFIENPDYASTNTIYSLHLAREHLENEDVIYFNADVWFQHDALKLLISPATDQQRSADALLLVDEGRCGEEEVKVVFEKRNRIVQIGKKLDPRKCAGEFIGIARFNKSIFPALKAALARRNAEVLGRTAFFEAALNDLLHDHNVLGIPLGDLQAVEIDTPSDYGRAKKIADLHP